MSNLPAFTRAADTHFERHSITVTQLFLQRKEVIMRIVIAVLCALFISDTGICLALDQSICNAGSTINYYPNGQLQSCSLKDNFNYGDIVCNQYSIVRFFNSGKLESCTLSRQLEIDGKTCKELESISLFENGKLKSCSKPN